MTNQVSILDKAGKLLWEGAVSSPVFGLQGGETFWYGTSKNRTWVKIVNISYGLETNVGGFHVEIVVEASGCKPTKTRRQMTKLTNHGEKTVHGGGGGAIVIKEGDIIVTVGHIGILEVDRMTLQVDSQKGPIIKTMKDVNVGSTIQIENDFRIVTATLTNITYSGDTGARVRITEHIMEEE